MVGPAASVLSRIRLAIRGVRSQVGYRLRSGPVLAVRPVVRRDGAGIIRRRLLRRLIARQLKLRQAVQHADRSSPHLVTLILIRRLLLALLASPALRGSALGRVAVLAGAQAGITLLECRHARSRAVLERLDRARGVKD